VSDIPARRNSPHTGSIVIVNVYLTSLFGFLALIAKANWISRRMASGREGLSFCCLARLQYRTSAQVHYQPSASGFFFILAANSTILLIASARDGTSIWVRRQSSTIRKKGSETRI
jgi:hypothetical protein